MAKKKKGSSSNTEGKRLEKALMSQFAQFFAGALIPLLQGQNSKRKREVSSSVDSDDDVAGSPGRRAPKRKKLTDDSSIPPSDEDTGVSASDDSMTDSDYEMDNENTDNPNEPFGRSHKDKIAKKAVSNSLYLKYAKKPPRKMVTQRPPGRNLKVFETSPWFVCGKDKKGYNQFRRYVRYLICLENKDGTHRYLKPSIKWSEQTLQDRHQFARCVTYDFPVFQHQERRFTITAVASKCLAHLSKKKRIKELLNTHLDEEEQPTSDDEEPQAPASPKPPRRPLGEIDPNIDPSLYKEDELLTTKGHNVHTSATPAGTRKKPAALGLITPETPAPGTVSQARAVMINVDSPLQTTLTTNQAGPPPLPPGKRPVVLIADNQEFDSLPGPSKPAPPLLGMRSLRNTRSTNSKSPVDDPKPTGKAAKTKKSNATPPANPGTGNKDRKGKGRAV